MRDKGACECVADLHFAAEIKSRRAPQPPGEGVTVSVTQILKGWV